MTTEDRKWKFVPEKNIHNLRFNDWGLIADDQDWSVWLVDDKSMEATPMFNGRAGGLDANKKAAEACLPI